MKGHVGFTGTQRTLTHNQKVQLAAQLEMYRAMGYTHLHHGDCIGADAVAHNMALCLGYVIVIHPPLNEKKREKNHGHVDGERVITRAAKEYLERNHDIVDESECMIACPRTAQEQLRSGTWATVRYARQMHKPVTLITP